MPVAARGLCIFSWSTSGVVLCLRVCLTGFPPFSALYLPLPPLSQYRIASPHRLQSTEHSSRIKTGLSVA